MIPTLHPFQADLYERVRARRAQGHRVIVVQGPTGCGKNTWAAHAGRQAALKGRRALFMVHRRRLVDQISGRLHQFEVPHGVLMRGEPFDRGCHVQVASRDTLLSRCVNHQWVGLPPADLVVVDEAHHAAAEGSEYRRVLAQYPEATVLLLSATPVGPDGSGLGPWATAIECAAPASRLVEGGFLVPVRCYAPDRRRVGRKYVRGIAGDLVASWLAHAEGRPTVLFCARVAHSRDAVEAFAAAGVGAAHLDAQTPDGVRDRLFDDVAAGRVKVLCNVGIVGEGVDVPELGCCQLFCEVGSRVRFLQAAGRVMRPAPGKDYGILIDHAGAVFRHGFPDEDTEWSLAGNADRDFAARHKEGKTERALYCKHCQLVYHGQDGCPRCGRKPVKPPPSIFAPPPVDARHEQLTEAERESAAPDSRDRQVRTWFACLAATLKRGGNFKQASAIFYKKYRAWPPDDFPCLPPWQERSRPIGEVYPNFGKRKEQDRGKDQDEGAA